VLAVIAVQGRRVLAAWAEHSAMATLGRVSLTVFTAHLLVCLAVLATGGAMIEPHPLSLLDGLLVLGTLVTLYGVARAALSGEKAIAIYRSGRQAPPEALPPVNARAAR
jgi:hypothetical protein